MTRLCLPDGACKGVDVEGPTGRSYTAGRDGTVTVISSAHERILRGIGAFPANVGGTPLTPGYPCGCGFRSLFRRCSKCGADNPRPVSLATREPATTSREES